MRGPDRTAGRAAGRLLVSAGLILAACTDGPVGDADGELVIGSLLPLTGADAEPAVEARAALDERVVEVAAAEEFDGLQIRLVHADATLLDAALDEFDANNVDVVIGPPGFSDNLRTQTNLSQLGTFVHLPLVEPADAQAAMMADAIVADGHAVASVLLGGSLDSSIGDAFAERFESNGGAVAGVVTVADDAERFDPEVVQVSAHESTAVLLLGTADPQSLIAGMRSVGAGPGSRIIYVIGNAENVVPDVGLRIAVPSSRLADRVVDRLVIAALATAVAGTDDPATVAAAIGRVVDGDQVCSSFSNCLSSLRESDAVRYSGAAANGFSSEGTPRQVPYRLVAFTADGAINDEDSRTITSG